MAGHCWARLDHQLDQLQYADRSVQQCRKPSFGMLKLMHRIRRVRPVLPPPSAFTGFRFPPEVIVLAVRWYLRYGLSYRDVEELLAERGVQVDHVTIYRWVQRFTPLLIDAARLPACTR